MVWDLATGRIRHVLTGHRGWSACVTCAVGAGLRPLALTGGLDNRVNVWDLRRGRRRGRFRIVSPWTFLARPAAGRAHAIRALPLDSGKIMALVATSDGMVRALEPRRFPWERGEPARVPADAVGTAHAERRPGGRRHRDGRRRRTDLEAGGLHPSRRTGQAPLCEINIEVPVSDISVVDRDTFVFATPNGLTAILLDASLLEDLR